MPSLPVTSLIHTTTTSIQNLPHQNNPFSSQTTNNKQQTTNNKQPTTNNQQPTTNNQQPTTNNQQQISIRPSRRLTILIALNLGFYRLI
ncbi:MAG: hypothetical protein F6K47_27885 [Symploca sp. SIO2E6]|nr:hypothetical protein [Symploca sp. SIO2E6]